MTSPYTLPEAEKDGILRRARRTIRLAFRNPYRNWRPRDHEAVKEEIFREIGRMRDFKRTYLPGRLTPEQVEKVLKDRPVRSHDAKG